MAQVIKNDLAAQRTLNALNRNNSELSKALRKVASGMRINGASDGASEYSISERMDVMIRSLGQDIDNAQTGHQLVRTAEGGIQDIIDNIRSMQEMAINAANDTNTDLDRETIQKEFSSRMRTIADIAATTNYNGRLLLNGDYREPREVAGISPITEKGILKNKIVDLCSSFSPGAETREFEGTSSYSTGNLKCKKSYDGTSTSDMSSFETMKKMTVNIDFSGATKDGTPAVYPDDYDKTGFVILCSACDQYINIKFDKSKSASESTYNPEISVSPWAREYVIGISEVTNETELEDALFAGIKAAKSGYDLESLYTGAGKRMGDYFSIDAEYYKKAATDVGDDISLDPEHNMRIVKTDSGYTFTRFVDGTSLCFYDEGTYEGKKDDKEYGASYDTAYPLIIHTGPKANQRLAVFINSMHPIAMGLNAARVNPREKAIEALDIVDKALNYSLNEITRMGAYQMRLEQTQENLVTAEENTTASKSTIQDADMAKEMQNYTKSNVLTQAAQSMLAQANQNLGSSLDLLQ